MTNNLSPMGTSHVRALLEAALESKTGIRVKDLPKGRAIYIRGMLHAFRNSERKKSMRIFQPEDARYEKSAYDALVTEITAGATDLLVDLRIVRSDVVASELKVIDESTGNLVDLVSLI